MPQEPDVLLTIKEAAARLGVSYDTMRRLVSATPDKPQAITSVQVSAGCKRVPERALLAYIRSRTTHGGGPHIPDEVLDALGMR